MTIESRLVDRILSEMPLRETHGFATNCTINLSSSDYIGFAKNNLIISAMQKGLGEYGVGSTGSRLLGGDQTIFCETEQNIANFFGFEDALIFGSGYLANIGVLSGLTCSKDIILFDRLSHASIIDGIKLSSAKWKSFLHNSVAHLEQHVIEATQTNKNGTIFVVTESLFSMDGDIAPLKKINELCKKYNAFLIVDESHSVGVFGQGKGLCFKHNIKPNIITFGLGKAMGMFGGICLCSNNIKKALQMSSRSFIFSTAPPPALCFGINKALQILDSQLVGVEELFEKAQFFRQQINNHSLLGDAYIVPLLGKKEELQKLATKLLQNGAFAKLIQHPSVPMGKERIRFSICAWHKQGDLKLIAEIINGQVDY